jgi:hypothetical protein
MKISISRPAGDIKIRIYTVSFRRVMEFDCGAFNDKDNTAIIPASQLDNLASGTYHTVVIGVSKTGDKAVSKPCEIIIIK